jgi:O-methyltransferase involved in polyketide biosynthesis
MASRSCLPGDLAMAVRALQAHPVKCVAPYLTAQAIESTLRTIAAAAPGSEVVFSYRSEDRALDDAGAEYARIYTPIARVA